MLGGRGELGHSLAKSCSPWDFHWIPLPRCELLRPHSKPDLTPGQSPEGKLCAGLGDAGRPRQECWIQGQVMDKSCLHTYAAVGEAFTSTPPFIFSKKQAFSRVSGHHGFPVASPRVASAHSWMIFLGWCLSTSLVELRAKASPGTAEFQDDAEAHGGCIKAPKQPKSPF